MRRGSTEWTGRAAALPAALALLATSVALGQPEDALSAVLEDERARVEMLDRAAASVVCIFADRAPAGGGSGVIISPEGYGLTNFHVVQEFVESRRGYGGLRDGRLYPLRVLGIDPGGDVAMFKLEGRERFDAAPLGDAESLRVGDWVVAMGNPFMLADDYAPTVTMGVVSGLHRYQEGQENLLEYADCIQVSTSINPGNSGGPLFDLAGRVVGINGRISFEERVRVNVGLGYAISINQIERFIPSLRAGRLCLHGTLGATVREIGGELVIDAVQDFSPAEKAGLELRDVLLSVMGRPMRTANDFNNLIATLPAEWPVSVRVRRGEQTLEATARLERLSLRTPMVYLPEPRQNRAEAAQVLDELRAALQLTGAGAPRWRATLTAASLEAPAELELGAATPEAQDELSDRARAEWAALAAPLTMADEESAGLELLGGDAIDGRIVWVVERRAADAPAVRYFVDRERAELLEARVGAADAEGVVVWRPADVREFDAGRWPARWTRRGDAGVSELEIEAFTRETVAEAPATQPEDSP